MPRSVFIICASDGAIDRYTNSLSLFKVIETLQYREVPAEGGVPASPIIQFKTVAVWAADEDDREVPFEHELVVASDAIGEKIVSHVPFVFKADNHRFYLTTSIGLRISEKEDSGSSEPSRSIFDDGGVQIISRIRREESQPWFTQEYFIRVEKLSLDQSESEAGNHAGREPI